MINKLFLVLKKIIMASLFIYAYDIVTVSLKPNIPINLFTVSLVSVFGIVAMFGLILFSFFF